MRVRRNASNWATRLIRCLAGLVTAAPLGNVLATPAWDIVAPSGMLTEVQNPTGFVQSDSGILIMAKNGLFILNKSHGNVTWLLKNYTVNDVEPFAGGLLVATDGGLFRLVLGGMEKPVRQIKGYSRSIRDILAISDRECFVASQDGLQYLSGDLMQAIGKNVQVDRLIGVTGEGKVVFTTDPEEELGKYEVGFATGELINFVVVPGQRTSAALFEEVALVGTSLGLFCVNEELGAIAISNCAIRDLIEFQGCLFALSVDGLEQVSRSQDGNFLLKRIVPGEFSDLAATPSLLVLAGDSEQLLLNAMLKTQAKASYPGIRSFHGNRQIDRTEFFGTNAGVLAISPEGKAGRLGVALSATDDEVRDIISYEGTMILATGKGLIIMKEGARANIYVIVALTFGACILFGVAARRVFGGPRVFISYRRGDSAIFVGRLHENLIRRLGRDRVVFDKTGFEKGKDFRQEIGRRIKECDVVMAVIGEQWLSITDENGFSRIESEQDFVRIELELSAHLRKPVVPVLLLETRMPGADTLPPSIEYLAYQNACRVRNDPEDFSRDFEALVQALRTVSR